MGFLGPRAFTAITGEVFPPGIQTAENLLARGVIDAIVAWEDLRARWATILRLWADRIVVVVTVTGRLDAAMIMVRTSRSGIRSTPSPTSSSSWARASLPAPFPGPPRRRR